MQELPYENQLGRKQQALEALLSGFWDGGIDIIPSPAIWHYRNKVDPAFDRMHYPEAPPKDFVRDTALGFRRKNRWNITLDIQTCRIGPEGLDELMRAVRVWYRKNQLRPFNARSGQGYLRFLVVRDGKRTGQKMVVLITAPGQTPGDGFVEAVQSSFNPTSIIWGTNAAKAEVAIADSFTVLSGEPSIDEELHIPDVLGEVKLKFSLSPFSFFQTNSLGAELLYGIIRKWVRDANAGFLYDLYGGSGAIGLACADIVEEIVTVESVASASSDGQVNAKTNMVQNMRFVRQEVEHYLRQPNGESLIPDAVAVLDPPRAGLHPKALAAFLDWRPREAIYVSCNPEAFARELPAFLHQYQIKDVAAVDMFPHTRHVELLARLARK
ncbi:MAG: 23S rRNA (uracil-5-)-methyltransferase RumA [Candidatus Hydrogenedentota bacterium]